MKQQILIVEDNKLNQKILVKNLEADYEIIQAFNGKEALEIIRKQYAGIAAVILDLRMPEMDGEELLEILSRDESYKNLPILVATGEHDEKMESRCLNLGAWDFVTKPYHPEVIHLRLRNIIGRSQMNLQEKIRMLSQRDYLTNLYNRAFFMEKTREMIQKYPDMDFVLIRMDIDNFRLYNASFGSEAGDLLLQKMGDFLRKRQRDYQTYGRLESDVFCICMPYEKEQVEQLVCDAEECIKKYSVNYRMKLAFGMYVIHDVREDMERMYSCVTEAARKCKTLVNERYTFYDEKMNLEEEKVQRIINEMEGAIREKQFLVYLQPKYSLETNKPCGAEALVRWQHPQQGMISPGDFIPVYEKNGQIVQLDYYMWESVCQLLHKWIQAGKKVYPVSVNISRISLYNPKIVEQIVGLTEKYQVPKKLLNLEITESAYMSNPDLMKSVTEQLREEGFVLLMDDFGSGYSSLNTLKDIDLDILKIDMKFLPTESNNVKSEKILASVIRMAGWLGMPVVVEGVETKEQKDFLDSIGCSFVQGFYFARPMPVADYEALIENTENDQIELPSEISALTDSLNAIWSSNAGAVSLMKSVSVPFGIFEYADNHIDMLRSNQAYTDAFGPGAQLEQQLNSQEMFKLYNTLDLAAYEEDSAECECLYLMENGQSRWYHIRVLYIGTSVKTKLLGLTFTDVTTEHNLEHELETIFGVLQARESKKGNLLIVDDSSISREILGSIFEDEFKIISAEDGKEGMELLKQYHDSIAAVLLDMVMPQMSGQEFLAYKNRIPEVADIPVIVISAERNEQQQIHMLESGVNDYVIKPFVPELVYRRLHNVLEYHSRFQAMMREYKNAESKKQKVDKNIEKMIYTDSLTNAYNRRYFDDRRYLREEAGGQVKNMGMVMLDLYQFKQINDSFGHQAGDSVLMQIVETIQKQIRKQDSLIRYGGDEFVIMLPNCEKEKMHGTIERLEHAIYAVHYGKEKEKTARADFGYAHTSDFEHADIDQLLREADEMMYRNKMDRRARKGKRVVKRENMQE